MIIIKILDISLYLTIKVIPIGKVTSDLSVLDSFDNSEEVTFSLAQ